MIPLLRPLRPADGLILVVLGLALLLTALANTGCAGAQHPESPAPWALARGLALGAREAVLTLGEALPPEALAREQAERCGDTAGCPNAVDLTAASLALLASAADAWEATATRPTDWPRWLSRALELVADVLDLVKAAGLEFEEWIATSIHGLAALLPILVPS